MPTPPRFRPALAFAVITALATGCAGVALSLLAPQPAAAAEAAPPLPQAAPAASQVDADDEREGDGEPGVDFDHRREGEFFRRLAGGEMDAERMRRMWADSKAMPSEAPVRADAVNAWQLAGPVFSVNPGGGFMTGRVRDIDAINVRALAASGGLWRFNIFGGIPMCDSVPASWFGSFATHPFNSSLILLGTGEYHAGGAGTGIYKTTDGGTTWTPEPMSPMPPSFSRVRWSADGATAYASSDFGFYRSTDAGDTWTRTMTGTVDDFSVTVGAPGLIYATQNGLGVWRSVDNGVTWAQLTTGGVPQNIAGGSAVSAVNFFGAGNVWIYVAFDTRIWLSTNNSFTWNEVTPTNFGIGNSGYGPVISANPNDAQTVLYGNVPYCRSTDAGATWSKIGTSHLHADYHVFAWDADGHGVWAGNDGGWSHSTDRGATWNSSSNTMPISQFYSIDCEKTELGYMIGGTQDNNILYTPTPTLNWIDPAVGSTEGDATGAVIDLYNPQHMWAISGVSSDPIAYPRYRTTDGGTNWSTVTGGIDPTPAGGSIRSDAAFPARLVTSTDTFVYESLDGVTWAKSNAAAFPFNVSSLTSSTRVANGAVLYATMAGANPGQRLFVRDNGAWVERSAGLPTGAVLKVVPHPWGGNNADEAWAIMSTFGQKFFHTTNRGVTWTNVTGDFPASLPVSDLVVNPRLPGELYVGSLTGCYRTKNGGVNWEHWNNGMPIGAMVSEMSYIDLTSTTGQFFVVAATYGRSVFKRDVSGEDIFPTLEVSSPFVQEGDAGQNLAWFRVRVPTPQSTAVTVDYSTQDGTATLANSDYAPTSGTLTFGPYQTEQWISVPVNGDQQIESDETFQLALSNPLRAQVGAPGVGTIQDDDAHGLVCGGLYVTDGSVNAIATAGNTVYIGGQFNKVGPATGSAATLDASSGLPLSLPKVDGSVSALAPDGTGGWYIGGGFKHVGGAPRTNLAHVLANGTLAPWNPVANDYVFALVKSGNTIYVGGRYTSIFGIPRNHLAALDATTGLPTAWAPEPDGQVLGLALNGAVLYVGGEFTNIGGKARNNIASVTTNNGSATLWNPNANAVVGAMVFDGGPLIVCGSFTTLGGVPRNYLAALDLGSGAPTAWNPNPDNLVFTIAANAGTVWAGGAFTSIGGQPRANLAALDRTSGLATPWSPNPDGGVNALAANGSTMYVGGTFANIGGQARSYLAAVSLTTGLASAWNPDPNSAVVALGVNGNAVFAAGAFTSLAAQPRASLAAFDAPSGQLLPWNPGADSNVGTLVTDGALVYAGGQFSTIGGQPRSRIAALDGVTGQATAWAPNANSTVRTLLLSGTKIYVGGSFTTIGGLTRNRIAALFTSTGLPTSWNPNASSTVFSIATDGSVVYAGGAFGTIGGQTRNGLAMLNTTSGAAFPTWNPSPNAPVTLLVLNGQVLYVGGTFTQIAGLGRPRLAAIDVLNGTVSAWSPAPNDLVHALVPSGSQIYVGGAFTAIGGQSRSHLALLRPSTNQVASSFVPDPDGDVNALALLGETLYTGGAFTSIGGMPQAHFGCLVPVSTVDAPTAEPAGEIAVRLSPNPSSGRVRIEYELAVAARVSISVYDVQGRRVGPAIETHEKAGAHATTWDGTAGRAISPGIYFLHFAAGAHTLVRRLVLL